MALKQPYMVKTGRSVTYLTLRADPGEAFLVKEIALTDTDPAEFTRVSIDRVTLAYLTTFNMSQNQFWWARGTVDKLQLMRHLYNAGIFPGFPIAEGQEMRVECVPSTSANMKIIYEVHEPADISPEMPCGTNCKEYIFFNYGVNTLEIASAQSQLINLSLTPKEFPDFPFGEVVPAKAKIELIAMGLLRRRMNEKGFEDVSWLKLLRGREVLFDEDRRGIFAEAEESDFPFHDRYLKGVVQPFPEPLVFMPGEELNLEATAQDGKTIAAEKALIFFVEKVTKLE